jgi:hypothetical protein
MWPQIATRKAYFNKRTRNKGRNRSHARLGVERLEPRELLTISETLAPPTGICVFLTLADPSETARNAARRGYRPDCCGNML